MIKGWYRITVNYRATNRDEDTLVETYLVSEDGNEADALYVAWQRALDARCQEDARETAKKMLDNPVSYNDQQLGWAYRIFRGPPT